MKPISYFLNHIDEIVDLEYVPINEDIDQSINLIIPSYNGHMINIITKETTDNEIKYVTYNYIIGTCCDFKSASDLIDLYKKKKQS